MTTMLEVARRAGVSKATVSRVLSGNGYTSQETRDRVFQAIEESGYRPNLLARQLATKNTQTLGLVVTNTLYHGVYFSELLFHTARMAEDKGRQLLLADGKHSAEEERQAIQYLLDMRCDAVIIYPRFLSVEEMDEIIEQHEQPIMVLNRRLSRHPAHCVYADQQAAAEAVVDKLVAMGHREIAFIAGSADSPTGAERLAGYRQALIRHGTPVQETLIAPGKWTPACGAAAVSTLLARGARFSALVASNDDMAIGAIQAIKEAGLKPGKDILTGSIDGVPDIYKAMIDGEANASVELTPNMAGPAFDALEKFKKDGTMPEKVTVTKSTLYLPDTAKEELEKKKNMGY